MSPDGARIFFKTREALVPLDTNRDSDVYVRESGHTFLALEAIPVSERPHDIAGLSEDGTRVFFETEHGLVPGDADGQPDVYELAGGAVTRVTPGGGPHPASYVASSTDGSHVIFETAERLTSGPRSPGPNSQYFYDRHAGETTLLFAKPAPDFSRKKSKGVRADFAGVSDDGSAAFFTTAERVPGTDLHCCVRRKVFESHAGVVRRLTLDPAYDDYAGASRVRPIAPDGSSVIVSTLLSLVSEDNDDGGRDVYKHDAGGWTLLSPTPAGASGSEFADFAGATDDLSVVAINAINQLTPDDTDLTADAFRRDGNGLERASSGAVGGNADLPAAALDVSADGAHVILLTSEGLQAADTDGELDLYDHSGGTTTLVSTGPLGGLPGYPPAFHAVGPTGAVVFNTNEVLVPGDLDTAPDVYLRAGGTTTLLSIGPSGGNSGNWADFRRATPDLSHVLFETYERLTPDDTDNGPDIYDASGGSVSLVTQG
jgi:Tol biopolymer transport system component